MPSSMDELIRVCPHGFLVLEKRNENADKVD